MKKGTLQAVAFITAFCLWGGISHAVYKVKKQEQAAFASPEEERIDRLDHGEILTDGGYLAKGVWGKMEGVVEAPPVLVWRIFLAANDWKNYGLPHLTDSRAVPEDLALQSQGLKKVDDYYQIIGDQVYDPAQNQRTGTVWNNFTFQYYDLPWPVANRWFVLKNVNNEKEGESGKYLSEWTKVGGNVNTLNGKMTISPFNGDKNRSLVEYYIESDPGSAVPRFLLKWGIKKTMPDAIRIVRRESGRLQSRPPPLLKTH